MTKWPAWANALTAGTASVSISGTRATGCAPASSTALPTTACRGSGPVSWRGTSTRTLSRVLRGITRCTVKNHVHNLLKKLDVPHRRAAGRYARSGTA